MRDGVFCGIRAAPVWIFQFLSSSPLAKKFTCSCEPNSSPLVNHPQFDLPGQTIGSPARV
jgi:hypothetical protein